MAAFLGQPKAGLCLPRLDRLHGATLQLSNAVGGPDKARARVPAPSKADRIRRTGRRGESGATAKGLRDAAAGLERSAAHPVPAGKAQQGAKPNGRDRLSLPKKKRAQFTSTQRGP
ncbi:hypothetical protein MesoLj113a_72040 [Mesorhizobium sp. 113-1-2]|nr:hypothetical protein MesoLj113a_72040 [Mesorhizobium sp. 113-1-2]